VTGITLRIPPAGVIRPAADIPATVVIPVRNEERNLPRCLAALSRFSEVIVVDSGSTDRTQDVARKAGVKLIEFHWNGRYPKKRNWVLLNQELAAEWVLFLDADEVVNGAFCDEVRRAISRGEHNGYWLNYTNYFLGRRLKYGLPQRKLVLFKVGSGLYERIQEQSWSGLDMEVHEHPIINGRVGEIRTPIEHNDFKGLASFLDRHRDYATWEAHRLLLLEKGPGFNGKGLTGRQRFKYRNLQRWWYSIFYFTYVYFIRRGCLDGAAGFYYAFYKAWYLLTIRLMIAEFRQAHKASEDVRALERRNSA
jgi:glycosyltransferase involved in cell wall biosynthesis